MLSFSVASYAFAPASVPAMTNSRVAASPTMGITPDTSYKPWTSSEISNEAGLKELAEKLNPVVGFWGARARRAARATPAADAPAAPSHASHAALRRPDEDRSGRDPRDYRLVAPR
jgi:hypothetical protein